MRKNRIIASLMALLMTLSAFSGLCVPAYADSEQPKNAVWTGLGFYVGLENKAYTINITDPERFVAGETKSQIVSKDNVYTISVSNTEKQPLTITNSIESNTYVITDLATGDMTYSSGSTQGITDYTAMVFPTYYDKLLTMEMMLENDTHAIFVQKFTGEVACYDKKSEQILFSNPYDVYTVTNKSESVKYQLLSQIILNYTDTSGNSKTMSSYEAAVLNSQITVKQIKNGVRVEYTMGREEANYLVPRMISKERFETLIKDVIYNHPDATRLVKNRFDSFYVEKNLENEELQTLRDQMIKEYPIVEKMPVYVLSTDITTREIAELEEFIKIYCPDYTYDELEYDHALTEYEGEQKAPANFKMSIEYSLNDNGMTARLPANGIRYDATNYTLNTIQILPYIGAGSNENTGYIFLPDGSGSITKFEDYIGKSINVSGTIYGTDYAYHTISGKLQETMRLPVYGIVDNDTITKKVQVTNNLEVKNDAGEIVITPVTSIKTESKEESRGFLAIIEEGDAMVSIMSTGGASTHKYYNVVTSFSPRQSDEYRLSDSISAASSSAIIVESKRKYVGSLTMRFVMLTDSDIAAEKNITGSYETSWMGMATAYREYLIEKGALTRITAEEVSDKMPVYIETFGTVETTEKIASIPVTVDKALTTFDQVKTMYDELSAGGVSNINFKLKGYYNGGMYSTVPYKLKWQKAAGGEEGFENLVAYANEKGFGVYPDFDFEYMQMSGMFDGFSQKDHAVKTIDDRYSSRIMYNPATQDYSTYGGLCISPSAFTYLFEGLDKNYSKYSNSSISVSTLGYALNSDFDEDDPYNREDSKALTQTVLSQISEKYENVMAEGGNAYTLGYVDHLLDVSLDSSRYALTSAAVPFAGAVLHGCINFTGSPINMEGDMDYALLKAIENGASLYFILSYDNTELLKEDFTLSQYYSVRYDIWKNDVIEIYNQLNSAIGDLQDKLIVDHEFLDGSRVPDADEAESDKVAAENAAAKAEQDYVSKITLEVSRRLAKLYESGQIEIGCTLADFEKAHEISAVITVNSDVEVTATTNAAGEKVYSYSDGIILTVGADKKAKIGLTDDALANAQTIIAQKDALSSSTEEFDKYATTSGTIAEVTYEGGTRFILNYNDYSVVCESDGVQYTIPAYSFVTIKEAAGKTTVYNFNTTEEAIILSVIGGNADNTKTVASGASIEIK